MMKDELYLKDIEAIASSDFIPFEKMRDSAVIISGSSGMIGSFLIDVLMFQNEKKNLNCRIIALGRNREKAKKRFEKYWPNNLFVFTEHDVNLPLELETERKKNYILHLASNTHPKAYATDPIATITTNVIGTKNLLDFAKTTKVERFVFVSSCEIYGESRDGVEEFKEDYCGYIDCNTLRAGYPESKRCSEALCQAYAKQDGVNIVIPRLSRVYGPTMSMDDSKAMSQFIKNGLHRENIVLKSDGMQLYSYLYVADAVSGILKLMLDGASGEAYNLAYDKSNIRLRDLANMIADIAGTNVEFGEPSKDEKAGFSKAVVAVLDARKANELGWKASYDMESGIKRTLEILGLK